MRIVLTQYAELIAYRRVKVREQSGTSAEPDMRTGWLLWQDSLRQFLYFEEEMLAPEPDNYTAKWVKNVGGGSRRESTNLWVYEKETGRKRYSITTGAGPKIQPYFDVPPPTDPNLYLFTVMGEVIEAGLVRVWLTTSTARELTQLLGALDTQTVSNAILTEADSLAAGTSLDRATVETAEAILVSVEAYVALQSSVAAVSDEHRFQLFAQHLRETRA